LNSAPKAQLPKAKASGKNSRLLLRFGGTPRSLDALLVGRFSDINPEQKSLNCGAAAAVLHKGNVKWATWKPSY